LKKPDLEIPGNRNVVLFVGRRSRLKGVDTLEEAIPQILDRRNDLQFVFVGDGREIKIPRSVSNHITVVGSVSPESIPAYFDRADILVHPSLTESFGRVLVEALFCNTPVIARDAGEMPTVTNNLFTTIDELVDLVVHFESLPLDDPNRYTPQSLKPAYIDFFKQFN
jgi:glycosyltransferase involved in cell wall biosynthesis